MNNHARFARKRSISSKRNLPSTKFLWHPAPALDSRTNPRWHLNPLDWMGNAGQREGFCSKCDVLFNHRQTLKLSIYERPSQRGLQKDPATDPAICCTFSRGHNQSLSTAGGQMPLSRSTTPMWPGLPLCCYWRILRQPNHCMVSQDTSSCIESVADTPRQDSRCFTKSAALSKKLLALDACEQWQRVRFTSLKVVD